MGQAHLQCLTLSSSQPLTGLLAKQDAQKVKQLGGCTGRQLQAQVQTEV